MKKEQNVSLPLLYTSKKWIKNKITQLFIKQKRRKDKIKNVYKNSRLNVQFVDNSVLAFLSKVLHICMFSLYFFVFCFCFYFFFTFLWLFPAFWNSADKSTDGVWGSDSANFFFNFENQLLWYSSGFFILRDIILGLFTLHFWLVLVAIQLVIWFFLYGTWKHCSLLFFMDFNFFYFLFLSKKIVPRSKDIS